MKPNYPMKDGHRSAGFGHASDCMAIAVNHDDALTFMQYAQEVGLDCEVLIAGDLANYAALHGATECVKALFRAKRDWKRPLDYYVELASKPVYGPNAMKKTLETVRG